MKQRGLTLIEVMIYIAIMAALVAVALTGVRYATRSNQRQAVQASQLTALKNLYNASVRYTSTRLTTLSDTTAELPIQTLLDAGALRPGWEGAYATAPGYSALGQRYTVLINRHADSKGVGITITETGTPDSTRMTRWDIKGTEGLRSWKTDLAQSYRRRYGEEVWLLDPPVVVGGAPQVRPLSLGGVAQETVTTTQDQLPLPTTLTSPAIAVTSRWSDAVRDTVVGDLVSVQDPSTCEVVAAPAGVATCPAGKSQVSLLPNNNCRYAQPVSLINSNAGALAIQNVEFLTSPDSALCGRSCSATNVPGCDASITGSGVAVTDAVGASTCPMQRYTTEKNSQLNLQGTNGEAGWFRIESNGNFVKHYYDRLLVDIYLLEGTEVGRQVCLEDRWNTPSTGTIPVLTAGTLQKGQTSGSPPMTQALCCVAR